MMSFHNRTEHLPAAENAPAMLAPSVLVSWLVVVPAVVAGASSRDIAPRPAADVAAGNDPTPVVAFVPALDDVDSVGKVVGMSVAAAVCVIVRRVVAMGVGSGVGLISLGVTDIKIEDVGVSDARMFLAIMVGVALRTLRMIGVSRDRSRLPRRFPGIVSRELCIFSRIAVLRGPGLGTIYEVRLRDVEAGIGKRNK